MRFSRGQLFKRTITKGKVERPAIGLGIMMRRNDGQFYACKTLLMSLSCSVKEVEALALHEALI